VIAGLGALVGIGRLDGNGVGLPAACGVVTGGTGVPFGTGGGGGPDCAFAGTFCGANATTSATAPAQASETNR
jgi:hypothetical protein